MSLSYQFIKHSTVFILSIFLCNNTWSQCSVQNGPPPSNQIFNTASNGTGGRLPDGAADRNWQVATDSINAVYEPAVKMANLPLDYYVSTWPDCSWISINQSGAHGGDHTYFYKMSFDLPCFTPCNKSYNDEGTFCLSLDLLADNSIYEIYVNGVPQSTSLGGIIPVPDPFHAVGENIKGMLSVSMCHNWQAGNNTLVIEVASSGPETGILIQASTVFPQGVSTYLSDSICEGYSYRLGDENITKPGYTFKTIRTPAGCDSTIALNLLVKPKAILMLEQSVCEGQSYLGHTLAGTYMDTFTAANGCDSIRMLHLSVVSKPQPVLDGSSGFCTGDSLTLLPGDFLSYLWQDGSTQNHYTVKTPGTYTVTVTNACGANTQSITVAAKDCQVYFPTAFTPNGDGKNDFFKILTSYIFEEYVLTVYNRWGQKVFETNDSSKGWDGRFNDKLQPSWNSFIWYCRYKKSGAVTTLKGTVVLIH